MGRRVNENPLNTRERVYSFIVQYKIENNGDSPTVREIAQGISVGQTTVHHHINRLIGMKIIRRKPFKSRSIEILSGYKEQ
jgi:SOS-response transcriptional repressor LexA